MALPDYSMRQLLEAGVHFGHQAHRWNPKMAPYIFGVRNNIHILDLSQTVPALHRALQAVSDTVANGGRVLFVGTKRQAQDHVADAARRSAQYFVNSRWLGGMLTNWKTISNSIARLKKLEEMLAGPEQGSGYTKKERLTLSVKRRSWSVLLAASVTWRPAGPPVRDRHEQGRHRREGGPAPRHPGGSHPRHKLRSGWHRLPVPGNDDAGRAIQLYCELVARAAIDGISRGAGELGDLGEAEAPLMEDLPAEEVSIWTSFEPLSGPARRRRRSQEARWRKPRDRAEAQRPRHLPSRSDRGPRCP